MILYKITCLNTGKIYIGITGSKLTRRWNQHWANVRAGARSSLYEEMRRIERDRWTIEIIGTFITYDELLLAERAAIEAMDSCNPRIGYNRTKGGQGTLGLRFKKTPEQVEKSARHHRGKKLPAERVDRLKAQLAWMRTLPRPSRQNPARDAAIMAHYFSSLSLALTGAVFGIKAAAVSAALKRCRALVADIMAATSDLYLDFVPPHRIHPDHLETIR